MQHVRWLAEPTLRRPTIVAAFTGWNDAGDAASNAVRHMIEGWGATALAEIDPEEFTDFATVRPHVRLADGRTRNIVWPTVGVWNASTPGGDVIIVLGPEPALRWRSFSEQIVSIATRYDAGLVLSLGALFADVSHTKPVRLIGTATDDDIIDRFDLQRSRYEGPTGIVGVLLDICSRAGFPSASLWAAVPAYASQVPSPKASLALVSRACQMLGTPAPIGGLANEAADYEQQVNNLIRDDDDLLGYVARLESMGDDDLDDDDDDDDSVGGELGDDRTNDLGLSDASVDGAGDLGMPRDLDSDELMAEVERFLREQPDS